MVKFTSSSVVVATFIGVALAQLPMFQLNCARYPDVCDNHCNAFICHGLSGISLHRDDTATDTGNGNRRRTAIGCGRNNYCPSGTDCDEYPYASTFDGGLGCYPAGFTGNSRNLIQIGTTRCTDPGQNRAHGAELSNFYNRLNIRNSGEFLVGLPTTSTISPLCDALATQGNGACPDETSGPYRFRTTPVTRSCPARGSRFQSMMGMQADTEESGGEQKVRTVYTDANQTVAVYGMGPGPVVGGKVWTPSSDNPEGGFISTITRIEE